MLVCTSHCEMHLHAVCESKCAYVCICKVCAYVCVCRMYRCVHVRCMRVCVHVCMMCMSVRMSVCVMCVFVCVIQAVCAKGVKDECCVQNPNNM